MTPRRPAPSRLALAALLLISSGVEPSAWAGNLVQDPGFESADTGALPGDSNLFTNGQSIDGGIWTVTQGTVAVDTETSFIFDGSKSLLLDGDNSGPDSVTQTLATTPGQLYLVSFWANSDVTNTFLATLGGIPITGGPTSIVQNGFPGVDPLSNSSLFQLYTGTVMASSNSMDLTFTATAFPTIDSGVSIEIDNISVSAVPEPPAFTLATIGSIVGCLVGMLRTYQWRRELVAR
jgi:hypothetical protein